jgi:hypothetical protein
LRDRLLKLPNIANAVIEESKVIDYLLSEENSGGKAEFFTAFSFSSEQWEELRDALFQHAQIHEVIRTSESKYGKKYIIEGELSTPDGRSPLVRIIWIVDSGKESPRLVTAYPLEREDKSTTTARGGGLQPSG